MNKNFQTQSIKYVSLSDATLQYLDKCKDQKKERTEKKKS